MQLYIKQKAFSWRCRFAVKDAAGNDRWCAEGKAFSWTHELRVYDARGEQAARIYRKNWTFFSQQYFIEAGGQQYLLVKEFSFGRPRFRLEGLPWRMEGNFWAHDYTLSEGERTVMRISKHWFTWGDSYELDIPNPRDELLCLCITLAVDCMVEDASNSN